MNITFIVLILFIVTIIYLLRNLLDIANDRKSKYSWYLLLVVGLIFIESIFGIFSIQLRYPHLYFLSFPLKFTVIPLLLAIGLTHSGYRKKYKTLNYFCLATLVLSFALLIPFYILDSPEKIALIKEPGTIMYLQMLMLSVSNFIALLKFKPQVVYVYGRKGNETSLVLGALILSFIIMLSFIFWSNVLYELDLILSFFLFAMLFTLKRLIKPKSKSCNELLAFIHNSMVEEKLFLDPNLSLKQLSNFLSVSPNEVSRTINSELSMGFKDYINRFRVGEVIRIIKDDQSARYTLEYISRSAGFNSATTFNKAFKKVTGKTPKAYRKLTVS